MLYSKGWPSRQGFLLSIARRTSQERPRSLRPKFSPEEKPISNYIFLTSYTDQGIRAIKLSPKRLDSARTFAANLGGQLKDFYLTFGTYDIVLVAEFPNDTAAAKFVLSVGSLGNVRTTTLKAFSEAEFRDIVGYLTQPTTT